MLGSFFSLTREREEEYGSGGSEPSNRNESGALTKDSGIAMEFSLFFSLSRSTTRISMGRKWIVATRNSILSWIVHGNEVGFPGLGTRFDPIGDQRCMKLSSLLRDIAKQWAASDAINTDGLN